MTALEATFVALAVARVWRDRVDHGHRAVARAEGAQAVTFTLPDDLAPEVYPLAWLVGSWSGRGVIEYPDIPRTEFRADVSFDHDGGPYLIYRSTWTVVGDDGEDGAVWSSEQGYWRVPPEAPDGLELSENLLPGGVDARRCFWLDRATDWCRGQRQDRTWPPT